MLSSTAWHQLTTPAGPSPYIAGSLAPGRWSNCTQCPRSRTLADVPYIFVHGQSCASVRMISNLVSKYRSVLDGFENNKSRQVMQYPLTSTIPSGVYPQTHVNTSIATHVWYFLEYKHNIQMWHLKTVYVGLAGSLIPVRVRVVYMMSLWLLSDT